MPVPLEINATANVGSAIGGLQSLGSEVTHVGGAMSGAQSGGDGFFGGLVGGAAKIGLAFNGVSMLAQGVGGLASGMVAGNAEMENYSTQFEVLTGSAQNAATLMDQLKEMGAKTPFEFTDLAKGTQTLLAFGVAQKDILPDMHMLGDISGGNAQKLQQLSLVFGQVASNGHMMGGDLLQMINAGFNPLNIISQKTGRSMSDLRDDMSKGKISFDMVRDAMQTATSQGGQFAGMMDKQSTTFDGMTSTLSDDVNSLKRTMMQPIFDGLKSGLQGVLPLLEGDQFQGFATAFATNVAGVIPVVIGLLGGLFSLLQSGWGIIAPIVATVLALASGFLQIATGAQSVSGPVGAMLGPLGGVADAFSAIHDGVVEVLAGFSAGGLQGAFSALVANIPTFLGGLQQIEFGIANQAVQWGMALINWIAPMVPGVVQGIADFFGAMFTWITSSGIPNAVSFLLGMADTLIAWIGPAIPGMLAQLETWGTALIGWVMNTAIPGLFSMLVNLGTTLVSWIGPKIPDLLAGLAEFGGSLFNWVTLTALPMIVGKLVEWANAFVVWLGPMIPIMATKLGEFAASLWNWLVNTGLPTLITKLGEWGQAMIAWIGPMIPPLLANLGTLLQQTGGWILNTGLPLLVSKLGEWGGALIGWVQRDAIPFIGAKLADFANVVWGWITAAAADALHKAAAMGASIIDGIKNGLSAGKDAVIDFIKGIAADAVDAIKNFFGISSPSKVMHGLFLNVGAGMLTGLQASTPAVLDHLKGVASGVSGALAGVGGSLGLGTASGVGGTMGVGGGVGAGGGQSITIIMHQDQYGNWQMDKLAEMLQVNVINRTGAAI